MKGKQPCEKCQTIFQPSNNWQRFCGSTEFKSGCSWEEYKRRKKITSMRYVVKRRQYIKSLEEELQANRVLPTTQQVKQVGEENENIGRV